MLTSSLSKPKKLKRYSTSRQGSSELFTQETYSNYAHRWTLNPSGTRPPQQSLCPNSLRRRWNLSQPFPLGDVVIPSEPPQLMSPRFYNALGFTILVTGPAVNFVNSCCAVYSKLEPLCSLLSRSVVSVFSFELVMTKLLSSQIPPIRIYMVVMYLSAALFAVTLSALKFHHDFLC